MYRMDAFLVVWQCLTIVWYLVGIYLARLEKVLGASIITLFSFIQAVWFFLLQAFPIHIFLWVTGAAVSVTATRLRNALMYDWFSPQLPNP